MIEELVVYVVHGEQHSSYAAAEQACQDKVGKFLDAAMVDANMSPRQKIKLIEAITRDGAREKLIKLLNY